MILKDNYDIEKIKKEQLKKIKDCIEKVMDEDKEYYKAKNNATKN